MASASSAGHESGIGNSKHHVKVVKVTNAGFVHVSYRYRGRALRCCGLYLSDFRTVRTEGPKLARNTHAIFWSGARQMLSSAIEIALFDTKAVCIYPLCIYLFDVCTATII